MRQFALKKCRHNVILSMTISLIFYNFHNKIVILFSGGYQHIFASLRKKNWLVFVHLCMSCVNKRHFLLKRPYFVNIPRSKQSRLTWDTLVRSENKSYLFVFLFHVLRKRKYNKRPKRKKPCTPVLKVCTKYSYEVSASVWLCDRSPFFSFLI